MKNALSLLCMLLAECLVSTSSFAQTVTGCTDILACNYDCTAGADDGSCIFPEFGRNCDGECWGTDMGSSVYQYESQVQLWSFYNPQSPSNSGTYMVPEWELPYSLEWHVNGEIVATSYPSEVCSQDQWVGPTNCIQTDYGQGPGWHCWETNHDANSTDAGIDAGWHGGLWAGTQVP